MPDSARRPSVTRLDDRLGLAVCRAGLSGRTLVTYARDHVTVRTPSAPDLLAANTIDLVAPPAAADLAGWVARFHDTTGHLGARHVQLRWEEPLARDAPPAVPSEEPALAAAAQALGLELSATTVLLAGHPPTVRAVDAEIAVLAPPAPSDPTGERRWHAARVLHRYADGDDPVQWRGWDAGSAARTAELERELAVAGRAEVWLAMRHGTPAGRATLAHDRQGLAAVQDVVVHPVHRRGGIASALVGHAVRRHLAARPDGRVGAQVVPATPAEALFRGTGFVPHATVWAARSVQPLGRG